MRKLVAGRPWLAAIVAWVVAVLLVSVVYGLWIRSQGEPFPWNMVRNAALVGAAIAALNAWRDSRRRRE